GLGRSFTLRDRNIMNYPRSATSPINVSRPTGGGLGGGGLGSGGPRGGGICLGAGGPRPGGGAVRVRGGVGTAQPSFGGSMIRLGAPGNTVKPGTMVKVDLPNHPNSGVAVPMKSVAAPVKGADSRSMGQLRNMAPMKK